MSNVRAWTLGWLGGPIIGIVNGSLREATYGRSLGARVSHAVSGATAVAVFGGYFAFLQSRWPLQTCRETGLVGGLWLGLTVAFEFGFGRLVAKQSWRELLSDYNLAKGRTWTLVLAWLACGPEVTRRYSGTLTTSTGRED